MFFSLVFMFILVSMVTGDIPCTQDPNKPCVCKGIYNGTDFVLDISKMLKFPMDNIPHVDDAKFKYNVDLCSGVSCNEDRTNECGCQSGGRDTYSLGKLNTVKWTIEKTSPWKFSIVCKKGDESENSSGDKKQRSVVFNFKEESTLKTDNIKMNNSDTSSLQYTFEIDGSNVKPGGGGGGGGGGGSSGGNKIGIAGLVIIILALVGILGYFIIGSVYMFHRRGARGVEVIPNLVFWKELPLLLKDGCVFTFGPCVRKIRGGHAYEKI